ncbi:MAG: MoaD/ThiS family protein [Anaerolineales bacterium]
MPVELVLRDRKFQVSAGQTIRQALENLDIIPETVLPVRKGKLVAEDEILKEGESIRLVAVISGGCGDRPR